MVVWFRVDSFWTNIIRWPVRKPLQSAYQQEPVIPLHTKPGMVDVRLWQQRTSERTPTLSLISAFRSRLMIEFDLDKLSWELSALSQWNVRTYYHVPVTYAMLGQCAHYLQLFQSSVSACGGSLTPRLRLLSWPGALLELDWAYWFLPSTSLSDLRTQERRRCSVRIS